jgi:hypothetical protein
MSVDVTAQPLFDGTFSIEAVAAAGHSLLDRLHDEAMATIAALAENWDQPVDGAPAVEDDEPVTYRDPASWSVEDDEDEGYPADEDDDIRVLQREEMPALLPRSAAANVAARVEQQSVEAVADDAVVLADAATDEFAVPAEGDRQFVAA